MDKTKNKRKRGGEKINCSIVLHYQASSVINKKTIKPIKVYMNQEINFLLVGF